MAKKTFFQNSQAFKSIEENNEKLNLIDGSSEFNQEYTLDFNLDSPKIEEKINENITIPTPIKPKPKRTNIPIFQEQYIELQCITLVTGETITSLVQESIEFVIKKYNNLYGNEIQKMKAIRIKKINK